MAFTAWVHLFTDALTSARVLADETARSPAIVEAYQQLIGSSQWGNLKRRLLISHLFGDANPLADLISRARWAEFQQLCRQLGLRPQRVEVRSGEARISPVACVPQVGETVVVPRSMWPKERCDELGGQGWRAVILRASPASATIRFLQAKTARGQPYEDVCVQTSLLMTTEPRSPDQ